MKLLWRRRRSRAERAGERILEILTFLHFTRVLGRWWWRTSRHHHRLSLRRS